MEGVDVVACKQVGLVQEGHGSMVEAWQGMGRTCCRGTTDLACADWAKQLEQLVMQRAWEREQDLAGNMSERAWSCDALEHRKMGQVRPGELEECLLTGWGSSGSRQQVS